MSIRGISFTIPDPPGPGSAADSAGAGDVQQKLLMRDDLVSLQDGLHNLIETPAFTNALSRAVASYFGPIFEPELVEAFRRFIAKGRRNDSRSYSVGIEPPAVGKVGRVKILERDETRIEAILFNAGASTVYVGGRQVTVGGLNDASGGIPMLPNTGLILDANVGELFAVSGTDAQDVRVLDIGGGI